MRLLILSLCLLLFCVAAQAAGTFTQTSVTAATSGPHPAFDANVNVLTNVSFGAAYILGDYLGYVRANFANLYLVPGNGSYVTTVGMEGRFTDHSAGGRFYIQESGPHIRKVNFTLGGYVGSDQGAWGKAEYQNLTVLAGMYDNFGSRIGIRYTVVGGGQVGAAWSNLLGPYLSYTHTFKLGK